MLLLLSACTFISDKDHEARLAELGGGLTHTDTDTGAGALVVEGFEPAFGTDAGGTVVEIAGGPFDSTSEVYFGTARADVIDASTTLLTVRTPASGTDGPVAVTVASGGESVQRDGAYTYWADATGLVGATGELIWYTYVGGYWAETEEDYGRSTLRFTEGLEYNYYLYWAPVLDTCFRITEGVPEYEYLPVPVAIDARGGTVTQRASATAIDLDWNSAEQRYTAYDLDRSQFADGEVYDLVLQGAPGLPDIEMTEVFSVPAAFQVSEPAIFSPSLPTIVENQHFAWNTDEPGDAVLIQLGMVNAAGDGFEQEIFCAVRDGGSFTIEDGTWTRWAAGRYMNILIGRYNAGDGLLPWNQGSIATASSFWNYGAATTR